MKKSKKSIFLPLSILLLTVSIISAFIYTRFRIRQQENNIQSEKMEKTIEAEPFTTIDFSWNNYIVITETPIPTPTKKPTPTPTKTPISIPVGTYEEWFGKYSSQYAVDRELLKKIAICESGLNPNASYGTYGGLFQFSESSWITTRRMMNLDANLIFRFNPEEAVKTAAFKLAIEGKNSWPNCGK